MAQTGKRIGEGGVACRFASGASLLLRDMAMAVCSFQSTDFRRCRDYAGRDEEWLSVVSGSRGGRGGQSSERLQRKSLAEEVQAQGYWIVTSKTF